MRSLPTERERRAQAYQHEQEMIAKYTSIHGLEKAIDYHWWHHQVEHKNDGQVYYNYEHDYPKPYSNNYLTYFIEIFFRKGSENNLLFYLDNDFIGDDIDAEYIESLLIGVKDYGLFIPKSILILNYGGIGGSITYGPPPNGGHYIDLEKNHHVGSYDVYIGSELNIERAELIRRWLKRRSSELKEQTVEFEKYSIQEIPKNILLIGKHYPSLGRHLTTPTLAALAAEWHSDLAVLGLERIDYYTTTPYDAAISKEEFLTCLGILLTEAEKYSHLRGYGYRQHFAPSDLTSNKESQLETSGNATLRAVRNWHTETSLPPIERFVHRACKIELWQNEQHQLTTLGLEDEDWRAIYDKLFIGLRRALYRAEENVLRTAYTELSLLLPTLHTRWIPRLNEATDEEDIEKNTFSPTDLAYRLPYCEFVPLQPLSIISTQRDVCLMAWLMTHINVKEWYVWQAVKLLAGSLKEAEPETPDSFKLQPPKPPDWTADQILTSGFFSVSPYGTKGPSKEQEPVTIYESDAFIVPSIWQNLLIGELSVGGFFAFLVKCGLLDAEGELTELGRAEGRTKARKAPWAGTLQALMRAGLLDSNAAAVCRVLGDPTGRIGVTLNEGTLRELSGKADLYLKLANSHLQELGFLRK
jgi:hypothetical protein